MAGRRSESLSLPFLDSTVFAHACMHAPAKLRFSQKRLGNSQEEGPEKLGLMKLRDPPFCGVRFSTESPAMGIGDHLGKERPNSICTHFYPLRGGIECKTMQFNVVNCNTGNSRIHCRFVGHVCFLRLWCSGNTSASQA